MTIDLLIEAYEKARDEWLKYLTFTGVKNPDGLKAYEIMVMAGEALDNARYPED